MERKNFLAWALGGALLVTATGAAPPRSAQVQPASNPGQSALQHSALVTTLQKRIKYVFVLYQENRSFDSYFGTFPGAAGQFSQPAAQTPGFYQQVLNVDGATYSTITPFRIGPAVYAADTDDVNHAHPNLLKKMDVTANGPQMDQYAITEEMLHLNPSYTNLQAKQFGELTMAYEDCDTIPLLWNYAHLFTLYDHIFQSAIGPSTPGNISVLGAQTGETQYGLHPSEGYSDNGGSQPGVPVMNDDNPAWGPGAGNQINLTFATLPVTLGGPNMLAAFTSDPNRRADFTDIADDISFLTRNSSPGARPGWAWYENGYVNATTSTGSFIAHHDAPQYFGYLANSSERSHLKGLPNFLNDLTNGTLPASGGVFYVKGGFNNILGLLPVDPASAVQANFPGDDDHPGYSDAQISEAQIATDVNAIAQSKYWSQSAIVIAWDDSEGDYDSVVPPLITTGPGTGNKPADYIRTGPRVPLILISPYAKTGVVVHSVGTQSSVVKLVDAVLGLFPLASLPDEVKGAVAASGATGHGNYSPEDGLGNGLTDLTDAFDSGRVLGFKAPLPASYAIVPLSEITTLPQTSGMGCATIGITPVDYQLGIVNNVPSDFDPRPIEDTAGNIAPSARRQVAQAKDPND